MTAPTFRTLPWLTVVVACALVLGGCAPAATDPPGGTDSGETDAGGDTGASTEACPVIPDWEYFSDSSVTSYPEPGQVFGDGTSITFEAPAEYYATYSLYYVDENGEVFENSAGAFSQEAPDGVFTTDLLVFGEEANNRPGILELETVYQDGMVLDNYLDTYQSGVSIVTLGRYCLTLKVSP